MVAEANRPLIIRVGKHLRGVFDRMIASSSLVANDPVLDVRDFAWTAGLRENWAAIRDEAVRVALQGHQPIMAAARAVHDTLKALREGTKPGDLPGLPAPGLMAAATRDDEYKQWTRNFLGGA